MLTVREALQLDGLRQAVVVAGRSGLDNSISCVDILEVPDTRIWLRPKEFLITTCYSMRDDLAAQLNVVRQMAQAGGAALAVKFGRFIGTVPLEMRQLADELGLPLISLPNDLAFIDITHPIMTAILNEQARKLEYSEQVHRKLVKTALEMNGLASIAQTLTGLIQREVRIYDDMELRLLREDGLSGRSGLTAENFQHLEDAGWPQERLVQVNGRPYELFPVKVRGRLYGFLMIAADPILNELDYIAIEHAVTVAALEMCKNELLTQSESNHCRDLMEDLISSVPYNRELARSRAERLGFLLDEPKQLLVADIDDFTGFMRRQRDNPEKQAERLKNNIYHRVSQVLNIYGKRALVVQRSDSVVAIIPASAGRYDDKRQCSRKKIQSLVQKIAAAINTTAGDVTVTIGVSTVVNDAAAIGEVYQRLRQMMRLARKINGAGQIVYWEDAQVYMMLGELGDTLEEFYQSTLGELENPGVKNREELLETLRVYLDCQGNSVAAAKKLYIHRNTLRYRLDRIEQILGRSLESPEDRFSIGLALKIRYLR